MMVNRVLEKLNNFVENEEKSIRYLENFVKDWREDTTKDLANGIIKKFSENLEFIKGIIILLEPEEPDIAEEE